MFTPPPVASQEPTPVVNKVIVAKEVSGRVRIKLPGTNRFIELDATQGIPVGSSVDTKQGVVELTSIPKAGAAPEKAQFRQGIFLLTQKAGITDLKLTEALSCPKRGAKAAAKKPKSRKLWGKGSGKFRTTGNYSAATVRGTEWLVQDTLLRHAHTRHPGRRRRPRQGQEEDDPRARAARALHGQATQVTRRPLAVAIALVGLAVPASASAATFTVTTTTDGPTCSGSTCTLRGAIAAAQANGAGEDDMIVVPAGTYALASPLSVTGTRITIDGAGANTTIIRAFVEGGRVLVAGQNSQLEVRDVTHPRWQRGHAGRSAATCSRTSAPG